METITFTGIAGLGILSALVGIAVTLFWMFVAWRAMRAHERIAKALDRQNHRPLD